DVYKRQVVGRYSTFDLLYATWSGSGLRHTDGGTVAMYRITMPGLFQVENAGVAVSALRRAQEAGLPITEQGIAEGLQHALWPGRMEMVSHHPRIVIDGAHNPYSIGKLVESLTHLEEGQRFVFVFGCMADKDIKGIVSHLVPVAEQIILTRADSDRAAPTGLLEETIHNVADPTAPPLAHTQSVQEALELVEASMPDTLTCVTGSLAVVGEARTAILGTAIQ
ncbi:MAG: hypothetical protein GYB64_17795, partial [Chloroflexi bacterium]|nr:hypothetical protein [Chloroflexota bacterium]